MTCALGCVRGVRSNEIEVGLYALVSRTRGPPTHVEVETCEPLRQHRQRLAHSPQEAPREEDLCDWVALQGAEGCRVHNVQMLPVHNQGLQ